MQEREFERIGGSQPIHADVRVIAATNRDLESAIAGGAFRRDLFYRLNVFPIETPPLRARRDDIPKLIEYFIHRYSRKAGKKIATIEKRTLELLESYAWPGNIRELQNVIERSVIVCETDLFSVDPSWLSFASPSPREGVGPSTRKSAVQEKEAIEMALADSGLRPDEIDYVNAHGTATPLNDRAETQAIKLALGERARQIPVSSTKSAIGHLLGAAGAVEAVATLLALRDRIAPPTLGWSEREEDLDLDYVGDGARPLQVAEGRRALALSNSFGFGGHNAVLCLEAA